MTLTADAPLEATELMTGAVVPSVGWTVSTDADLLAALGLSAIEVSVLTMSALGADTDRMARSLLLPAATVAGFLRGAYRQAGATTREEALLWAVSEGLLTPVVRDDALAPARTAA